jgi:hypothetical protein
MTSRQFTCMQRESSAACATNTNFQRLLFLAKPSKPILAELVAIKSPLLISISQGIIMKGGQQKVQSNCEPSFKVLMERRNYAKRR